jgi:hypothetical protein
VKAELLLDKEFEAKVVTGMILQEAGKYDSKKSDLFDVVPHMYGSQLSSGQSKLNQSAYKNRFNVFLRIVDKEEGHNGLTSQTPGAVSNEEPKLLKRLLKN